MINITSKSQAPELRRFGARHPAPRVLVLLTAWASALAFAPNTSADEGGVPFWFSGQYASLAAVPATPGWALPMQSYAYEGDATRSKTFTRGDSVTLGLKSRVPLFLVAQSYEPETKLLGGPYLGSKCNSGHQVHDSTNIR